MRIYIAGPYTADTIEEIEGNVSRAKEAFIKLVEMGHHPYLPHLSHYVELSFPGIVSYEKWMEIDQAWLGCCDCLLLLAPSPGALVEVNVAIALGLEVFRRVEDIPDLIEVIVPKTAQGI